MEKYVLYIDYLKIGKTEYIPMRAKTFKQAIEEADALFNPGEMYLMRIMEKSGNVLNENPFKAQLYKAIECKRSFRWFPMEGNESEHIVKETYWGKGICMSRVFECQ